jgi:hypothetical protein
LAFAGGYKIKAVLMDGGSEYLAALRNSNPSQATLQNYLKDNTALIVRLHHELAFGRAKNRPENHPTWFIGPWLDLGQIFVRSGPVRVTNY